MARSVDSVNRSMRIPAVRTGLRRSGRGRCLTPTRLRSPSPIPGPSSRRRVSRYPSCCSRVPSERASENGPMKQGGCRRRRRPRRVAGPAGPPNSRRRVVEVGVRGDTERPRRPPGGADPRPKRYAAVPGTGRRRPRDAGPDDNGRPGPLPSGLRTHHDVAGSQRVAGAACARADGVWRPTIAGASWMRPSFVKASTMNNAKSTRRVMLLFRMGSPTCLLQTGKPWLSPSSRSLPRTRVQRVSLAKIRRHASTWSSRSMRPVSFANRAAKTRRLHLPWVDISAVPGDVPSGREDEA